MENSEYQAEHEFRLTVFDTSGQFYMDIFAVDRFFLVDFARFIRTHTHTRMQTSN